MIADQYREVMSLINFHITGGDGPEAVTAAMHEALTLDWRPQASRMAVLITDAPPHVGFLSYLLLSATSR